MMNPAIIEDAHRRIAPHVNDTPLIECQRLNDWLGHRIVFKVEGMQKVGAFKFRGAMNCLLRLQEKNELPREVVAFSSGNHAQAMARAAAMLGVAATVFIPRHAAAVKRQAARAYGAEVVVTETRRQAEEGVRMRVAEGAMLLHPFDNDDIIAGQGTACYEALATGLRPDVVIASCGGGGWLSGTWLASQLLSPESVVLGAEPELANDAARSLRSGSIVHFSTSPRTIADGAQTLAVSERTFAYLKQLEAMIEVPEEDIIYWSQWLNHLLKCTVEPTSALAMGGLCQWLKDQRAAKTALVLLSGGNIAAESYRQVWAHDHLGMRPTLDS